MREVTAISTILLLLLGNFVDSFQFRTNGVAAWKSKSSLTAVTRVEKTTDEWKEILTPEQFYVLREEGTEAPNTSQLNFVKSEGIFSCAGCGAPLFVTSTKFDSGTGWPSFYAPIDKEAISLSTDFKLILPRTECSCASCGGHLGHVFDDGPDPTGQRFCMNGVAMTFTDASENPELDEEVSKRQRENPYALGLVQVLPSVIVNGIIGGLFFSSFATRLEMGFSSPLEALPLIPAVYFGVLAVRSCGRMSS